MSGTVKSEARLLNASESEMAGLTLPPEIGRQSVAGLKALLRRLREAHNRASDIGARQQREIRGQAEPHGAQAVHDNTGTLAKAKVLREAIERIEAELSRRENANAAFPSN